MARPWPSPPHETRGIRRRLRITPLRVALLVLAVATVAAGTRFLPRGDDPVEDFWGPVLSARNPILLCVGNLEGGQRLANTGSLAGLTVSQVHSLPSQMMLVPDAVTLARFTGLLQAKGKTYRVTSQSEATFADLQNGPAVLVGLANNDWTERLVGKLRFTMERRPPGIIVLTDRERPNRQDWFIDYRQPYLAVTKDYALVVRVVDPKTEQIVVTAAGISLFGTLAAGEFLTNPQELKKIAAVAPKGWKNRNFELVLATDVIRGKTGRPSIVASHFW